MYPNLQMTVIMNSVKICLVSFIHSIIFLINSGVSFTDRSNKWALGVGGAFTS